MLPRILVSCPLLLVLLGHPVRGAQESKWLDHFRAGQTALNAGKLDEAEKQFNAAAKEAEGFKQPDRRYAASLSFLGVVNYKKNKHGQAESLYRKALEVYRQAA